MKTFLLHKLTQAHTLKGKAFTIQLQPFDYCIQCLFYEDHLELKEEDEAIPSDARLTATPLQLLNIVLSSSFKNLQITGDAAFARDVMVLLREINIDWEEHLARWIGDIPAFHAHGLLKQGAEWLQHSSANLAQTCSEYIHEEAKWLPTREALADFFDDIDVLRMDTDRMEARIKNLEKTGQDSHENI